MLTVRAIHGFDIESANLNLQRFRPHVPSIGFPLTDPGFLQSFTVSGYQHGNAWLLFYTAGSEFNAGIPLDIAYQNVVVRLYFKFTGQHVTTSPTGQTWLRFEGPSGMGVNLRRTPAGLLQVNLGGNGTNGNTGQSLLFESADPLVIDQWYQLEIRIESTTHKIWVWLDGATLYSDTGVNMGTGVHTVTLRWENGSIQGIALDHVVVATDDESAGARFRDSLVYAVALEADYAVSTWTPNAGTNHFSRLIEAPPTNAPDDDTTYLAGTQDSGDDLFTLEEPDCVGYIWGVALNVFAKGQTGQPSILHRLRRSDGAVESLAVAAAVSTSRYELRQVVTVLNPVTADAWNDPGLRESAWGFRGAAPAGDIRVTSAYIEKLVDATGELPFDCGGGSYIL